MSSISHSNSLTLESSKCRESQCSSKKKKVIFEEELRGYKPKETSKATTSYDPMVEKLKQWKKERETKQQNSSSNSQVKELKAANGINLLQKKTFESSLRSYKKQSLTSSSQIKSRLQSSLQQFYDRVNNRNTKSMSNSQYFTGSLNRSSIFSSIVNQSHKKGYYSENNSVCPSLDKNNIDFIDQIEDRIEDLYYDFMEGNIMDRQQMRKEIIDILHMCQIKIVKGKMIGGIEEIKSNQQLWYIFLLNFDFKPIWKENAIRFIKENNIMQQDHLELAEQNMRIISEDQSNISQSQILDQSLVEGHRNLQDKIFIKFEQMDNLKFEDTIKQENMEQESNFQSNPILGSIKEESIENTQDTLITYTKTNFKAESNAQLCAQVDPQLNSQLQPINNQDIVQNNQNNNFQQNEYFTQKNQTQIFVQTHQSELLAGLESDQQFTQRNQNEQLSLKEEEEQQLQTKLDSSLLQINQDGQIQTNQNTNFANTQQPVYLAKIQNDENIEQNNQSLILLPNQTSNQIDDLQNKNNNIGCQNLNKNQMEVEEHENESLMIPQNIFKKFEFLQAEIAHSYTKAQRMLAQNQSNNKKLSEAQQDLIELSYGSQLIETPSYSEQNSENNIKSIVKKLDYKLNLDNQLPLFDLSPWRDMKKLNEQANQSNSIFKSSQSIFKNSQNKSIETDAFLEKQRERMFKFSFGNNNALTPLQQDEAQNNQQKDKSEITDNISSVPDSNQKDQIQKQLFEKVNDNNEGETRENIFKYDMSSQSFDNNKINIKNPLETDKNIVLQQFTDNFNANKIFTETDQNKPEKETLQKENVIFKSSINNIFANNNLEKKISNQFNTQHLINEKENIQQHDQSQHGIFYANIQESSQSRIQQKQNKIFNLNNCNAANQYRNTEKELFVQKLNEEEEENQTEWAIRKKIKNELGFYQDVCDKQPGTLSKNDDLRESTQISILLNSQVNKPTTYHDEFSFNFKQLTNQQTNEGQQNNLFSLNKEGTDESKNQNEQQNTCSFSSIINNSSNLIKNNTFQSLNQNLIQNNSSFTTTNTNLQNFSNNLLTQNQELLQNQISNQATLDKLHSQNHFNYTSQNNQISILNIDSKQILENKIDTNNGNVFPINNSKKLNEISPQKQNNQILKQITSEKRQSIFSSKKRSLICSPQVFQNFIESEKKQSQDFIQNLSQSKKKSLLGLDVQDIIKTQVSEDFGSEFVQLTITPNSVKKQKKPQQEENFVCNKQQSSMLWVRRSLRLMNNNQSPPSSQSLKSSSKKYESCKSKKKGFRN
ncbi:hypothetical protein TTHERM_000305651 (macronuclear) [Tetrahymena thermophila SB210]|uniref:Uncharacterized protein n=1 Tax=Tetrahymena thermophila (strain SB210) TaxID=312017 RepID=W7X1K7_TETTS|nr:hypothetical protein TTHERM_000305651 [Tetrahymena thermophila SB210]EWS73125.1 hypothetical protein TTHERM_000305651 [Tetrahymena thermophila SB210]|eukprot:XP_012654312.1 hypothetical protein TTHERM_000305651 [Tetrahymena thermophila SB210]